LVAILTEPKNSLLKQYCKLFEFDGIELIVHNEVLEFIVDKAMELKLGARGLRSICEAILTDAMFNAPSMDLKKLDITLDYAKEQFGNSKVSKLKVA
jgi:ATP-dependent Clp protease ATP-binding subunit ClpX